MKLQIKNKYTTDDTTFLVVEQLIAIICIFIPLFLYLADNNTVRGSISAYVDMDNSYIYGLLLGIAAMLFIFNGALYFKTTPKPNMNYKKNRGKWYNIILGVALMGVTLFPYNGKLSLLHYFFTIVFFAGSAVVMFLFQNPKHMLISRILAIISLFGLGLCVFGSENFFNLFWAEWIALVMIGLYYILESKDIILLKRKN
ncbi:hypothetical protein UMM65_08635 [Aureibaculum sp. 2210JD6-5]|uniref:DUF7103 family protein n=1 Tax=Aureibaculum sp. 2210JD6-5 TaxID=3103957 RepID=UPI002AAD1476|nr:hypothetical protein [Aureibaculum sp. 2210JD6-5]MDY7395306.1 hypothetical protein [Aureibaculum sp. 2210JD6-5]